jgi:hypothetical protein
MWDYIWDSKPALLRKEIAILDNQYGGLVVIDLESIVNSKQVKLKYQITHSEPQIWNAK